MRISVRHIQETVAADFGVPVGSMWHPTREHEYTWPRHYAMLLARELTPVSLPLIGRLFARDHSTVISGIRSAKRRIEQDRDTALKIEARALLLTSEPEIPQFVLIDPVFVAEAA